MDRALPDLLRLAHGLRTVMAAQAAELSRRSILHDSALTALITPCLRAPPATRPSTSSPPPVPPPEPPTAPSGPPASAPPEPSGASTFPETPPSAAHTQAASASASPLPKRQPPTRPPASASPSDTFMRERAVPESPLARLLSFGSLAISLAGGAAAETARRAVRPTSDGATSAFITEANATRLAAALSRMRGAALKLGQMLSIQDDAVVPPVLLRALERVRHAADVMPARQLHRVLDAELGGGWRDRWRVVEFGETPVAAASIGQVHRAVLRDDDGDCQVVAVKIQYPGVARSIKSDLANLKRLVTVGNFVPESFFLDEALAAAEEELERECDYAVEAAHQTSYREHVLSSPDLRDDFYVPRVYEELSTSRVLVSEFVPGVPVDRLAGESQSLRDAVATRLLRLTLAELFIFGLQQSDPNWSNYLFDAPSARINLVDFGAARAYDDRFLMRYLALIRACAARDRDAVLEHSVHLGFLTGEESREMLAAHVEASFAVGEPFHAGGTAGGFDFSKNDIPARTAELGKLMLHQRLTPPPKEAYSLHRRLSGAFLISMRLGATVDAASMLEATVDQLRREGRISD